MVLLRQTLVLVVALTTGCTFQFLEEGPYVESFQSAGRSAIEIKGVDGDMQIQGSATATELLIRGTRRALGSTRDRARENLQRVRLGPRAEGAQLTLELDPPLELVGLLELELVGPSVLPHDLGLTVEVTEGDLAVDDLRGETSLET
ncbi:MAG: hypothetical protein JRF63_08820, partial [Deltaproteobacteria bacterium]|nr:hypothetical protein [Deltaproteobacteria bacterium]